MSTVNARRVLAAFVLAFVAASLVGLTGCSSAEPDVSSDTKPLSRELRGVDNTSGNNPDDGEVDQTESGVDTETGDPTPESLASTEGIGPDSDSIPEADLGVDPETSSDPLAPASSQPTELDLLVSELMVFVERERGHEFVTRPDLRLLSGTEFTDAFSELIEQDAERYREDFTNFTDIYQAMGIIDGSRNLAEIWSAFGDAGVLGYYDNELKNIVLRGGAITPLTETILVHELTHALDDQIFDIDRPEYDDRDDEISWSLSAIAEGNARVIEARYRATLTSEQRSAELEAQRNLPRGVSLSTFTSSFLELQFSRYRHGEAFVAELWDEGVSAVDAAFTNPPPTSEMVVDASQYSPGAAGDDPAPTPPADGTVFESGVWGQVAWAAIFADVNPDRADQTSEGWGGDWYVAWRSGDLTCVRANIEGDSAAALDGYAEMLEVWAALDENREIFYPTAELIRVTACG